MKNLPKAPSLLSIEPKDIGIFLSLIHCFIRLATFQNKSYS